MSKVIFITGSSKGFGKIWAKAALESGYRVAASARNTQALKNRMKNGKYRLVFV